MKKLLILIPIIAIGFYIKKQMDKKQILEKLKIDEEYYSQLATSIYPRLRFGVGNDFSRGT